MVSSPKSAKEAVVLTHQRSTPGLPPKSLLPITVVQDDPDLFELLRDVFAPTHRLSLISQADSMTAIAAQSPTLLFVGPFAVNDRAALSAWDVVALARAHRDLRTVPIVVFTTDANLLADDGSHLGAYPDVHVVGIPFDLDVLEHVVSSIQRRSEGWSLPAVLRVKGRLPELCPHGYDSGDRAHHSSCGSV